DGDGRLDVAVACHPSGGTGAALLFVGEGHGGFLGVPSLVAPYEPQDVVVADMNRDGKPDIVVVGEGLGQLSLFSGKGDGTFGARNDVSAGGVGPAPVCGAVGDVNGDGK